MWISQMPDAIVEAYICHVRLNEIYINFNAQTPERSARNSSLLLIQGDKRKYILIINLKNFFFETLRQVFEFSTFLFLPK